MAAISLPSYDKFHDCESEYDSDKENIPPEEEERTCDVASTVGNRVIRLNEGPLPANVIVPRDFAHAILSQCTEMRERLETVIAHNKKIRDAARKRHERARKKLANEVNDLREIVAEKEAIAAHLEKAMRDLKGSLEKLRTQLSDAKTELANEKVMNMRSG
eukprot:jgi/Mesvir1/18628/Mv17137-RA.1